MDTVLNRDISLLKPYPLFFLGFVSIVAYFPGIIGATIPTNWFVLFIIAPFFLLGLNLRLGFGFCFICYAILSLAWLHSINVGILALAQIILFGCLFTIGQNLKDLTPIFKGLGIGLGVASLFAIAQYFGYRGVYSLNNEPAALFINKNIYSEISAILLISFVIFKLWWFIPVALPGLILVQSRAAYVALAFGLFAWGWRYNKKLAIGLVLTVGLIGVYFYWGHFQISSFQQRLELWVDTIKGFKLFGNGVGSYETIFPSHAYYINTELERPKFAHNDLLQLIFEFGVASILIFMVMLNVLNSKRKETIIVWSILLVSLFTYPFHAPTASFVAFVVAGFVVGNADNRSLWIDWRPVLFKRINGEQFKFNTQRQIISSI